MKGKSMYVIKEVRRSDFERDECFVHATLYRNVYDAARDASKAVGASVRYQIANDMVEDPHDLDFDLGVCDPNVFEVEGPSWSCHCKICEVTERTPFEVVRVDHDYYNRTKICTVGRSDTREGAVNIIEADAAQEIELIADRMEDHGASLTVGVNADYELIGEELYSEYFIRNNA